jgi:hypothetical protein
MPVNPLENLKVLLDEIIKFFLTFYPVVTIGLVSVFLGIILLLLWLLSGNTVAP